MKRAIAILLLSVLLFGGAASADVETWATANQTTIGWDAVIATVEDGAIQYGIYLVPANASDRTTAVEVMVTADLSAIITLPHQGKYIAGVRTLLFVDGERVAQSEVAWSDDPVSVLSGVTFGLRYFDPPGKAVGLHSK
jgi:hypothetical protein